ncbi:MAG: enoyl-CoA hydratase/isomerase family protein [Candidatus Heimdallarchaeota archaeon]|nr:MAG: enoyl-CoA hydratase/isomerase family protein [Candidatus Heimdallarchaeota archaeon]
MNNSKNSSDSKSTVLFQTENQIATITINRPEKRNALRMKEFDAIIKYIKEADNDSNVHVIRICSSGSKAFSAGLDLNMLQQLTPEKAPKLVQYGNDLTRTILKAKKPVVNQVQGPAVAWGTILCLAADFVIAGENPRTFFSLPEIDINLFPATGALTMALFKIGYKHAKKILMIPEKLFLDQAKEIGLVTITCPLEALEQTTIEFCQNLSNKPQGILIPIKILLNNFLLRDLESYFEIENEALELAMTGDLEKFDDFITKLWHPRQG